MKVKLMRSESRVSRDGRAGTGRIWTTKMHNHQSSEGVQIVKVWNSREALVLHQSRDNLLPSDLPMSARLDRWAASSF